MEISNDVILLLDRCRAMNCIYEGQSFSRRLFTGTLGTPDRTETVIEEMLEKGLVVKTPSGAYSLTSIGAVALMSASADSKQRAFAKKAMQPRPPINRL